MKQASGALRVRSTSYCRAFLLFVLASLLSVQSFVIHPHNEHNHNVIRQSNPSFSLSVSEQPVQEESSLSDVDARVLREMLAETKLDLQTEEDIRKLLARGTVKSTVNPKVQAQQENRQRAEESPFASTLLQTLADTTVWKKLSAQTTDLLESAKIWVANKVEQDLQVAAALGLFAWERAVKDVARALPASASTTSPRSTIPRNVFALTNQSSYEEIQQQQQLLSRERIRQDLNRPSDEIKDVSRAIWGILQGDTPQASANARGLRTAAQAGTASMADRQRRAFRQRRKLDRRDWSSRVAGGVVDATYELQQELNAETSTAGYKTKPLRQAIQAGTVGVLTAVRDTARLAAANRQSARQLLQPPREKEGDQSPQLWDPAVDPAVMYTQLVEERTLLQERLSACIDTPLDTWLSEPSKELARDTLQMNEDSLREVATLMVLVRNDMLHAALPVEQVANTVFTDSTVQTVSASQVGEMIQLLREDLAAIQELRARVSLDVSTSVAEALYSSILGIPQNEVASTLPLSDDDEAPLILRLDQVQATLQARPPPPSFVSPQAEAIPSEASPSRATFFADVNVDKASTDTVPFASSAKFDDSQVTNESSDYTDTALVVDVVPENVVTTVQDTSRLDSDDPATPSRQYKSFVAEVVSEEDVASAFGEAKTVQNLSEEELAAEEGSEVPNIAVQALLRVFDVSFFVLEKTVTVVLPAAIRLSVNAKARYEEIQRNGLGQKGWEYLRRCASAKGRY